VNERILIIDDEPWVHEIVRAYLERDGFMVYGASDGRKGLDLALTKRPDLVVLDLMLPDLSGEEICRQLRERSDVAILMLTAKSGELERVTGLGIGADDYLTRPFSPLELLARVKAVLRPPRGGELPRVELLRFDGGRLEIDSVRQRGAHRGRAGRPDAERVQAAACTRAVPGLGVLALRADQPRPGSRLRGV
jgi:DNA-binding response OmpR family regulator